MNLILSPGAVEAICVAVQSAGRQANRRNFDPVRAASKIDEVFKSHVPNEDLTSSQFIALQQKPRSIKSGFGYLFQIARDPKDHAHLILGTAEDPPPSLHPEHLTQYPTSIGLHFLYEDPLHPVSPVQNYMTLGSLTDRAALVSLSLYVATKESAQETVIEQTVKGLSFDCIMKHGQDDKESAQETVKGRTVRGIPFEDVINSVREYPHIDILRNYGLDEAQIASLFFGLIDVYPKMDVLTLARAFKAYKGGFRLTAEFIRPPSESDLEKLEEAFKALEVDHGIKLL